MPHNSPMQVFVSAVMATLAGSLFAHPLTVGAILLLAFAIFFAMLGLTMLIFRRLGREHALALGLTVAQRNMGLMLAATAGVLPAAAWLYCALCQFPMYIMPHLLRPLARARGADFAFATHQAANARSECQIQSSTNADIC